MINTDKHEKKLKEYEYRKNELLIYTDRSEEHPLGAYKFRQKDWQVRRFINDAVRAGWTLSSMKEIYDEAMEEVKRLTKTLEIIAREMPHDYWLHTLIEDVIGYEKWQAKEMKKND